MMKLLEANDEIIYINGNKDEWRFVVQDDEDGKPMIINLHHK